MATKSGTLAKGISLALVVAGPIFVAMLSLYEAYLRFPHAIEVPDASLIPAALMALPVISVLGAIISLPANLIGGLGLGALCERYGCLRPPPVWTIMGLSAGMLIAFVFSRENPQPAFALIATSTICARICRHWVEWEEPADQPDFVDPWPRPCR